MYEINPASLVNIVGSGIGVALYILLGLMVLRNGQVQKRGSTFGLLFATSVLGTIWNLGEIMMGVSRDLGSQGGPVLVSVIAYSALGFLPSVIIHSALKEFRGKRLVVGATYVLSSVVAIFHLYAGLFLDATPSRAGLWVSTFGAVLISFGILFRQVREKLRDLRVLIAGLLIFILSALHFGRPGEETSALVELVAHQSSLPLVVVILIQNYRFAFGDIFLKRALSLMLLALSTAAAYLLVVLPLISIHEEHRASDPQAVALIVGFAIVTAVLFPILNRFAGSIVDRLILSRPDFATIQTELTGMLNSAESVEEVNDRLSTILVKNFRPTTNEISKVDLLPSDRSFVEVSSDRNSVEINLITHDPPFFKHSLKHLSGARRLLSGEMALLEFAAVSATRRIDSLRVTHERCEQDLKERHLEQLASEAQLSALRSQINPHFLFNSAPPRPQGS